MAGNSARRLLAVLVALIVVGGVAVVVAGSPAGDNRRQTAAPPRPPPTSVESPSTTTTTSRAVDPYAVVRPLAWAGCGSYQCADLDVPLDYADPTGPRINVALERRPASGPRLGSLVINPGGPGESGLGNFAKDLSILPAEALARFDVVTFDPRGVGKSSPVRCTGDSYSGPAPDPVPASVAAAQPLLASDQAYATACLTASGALLLAHVGTLDVARDLEVMRRALGDAGLTFVGLSYGTLVGATYAGLFPTHVRAMVLDGPIDPSLTTADLANAQASGFEASLSSFFTWCLSAGSGCAWHPAGDPHAAFQALAAKAPDRGIFFTGTFGTLYSRSFWPSLGRALAAEAAGDGSVMQALYSGYERVGDPSFSGDANNAITCLDHPVARDVSSYPALAASAARVAPDFGPLFAWGALACAVWPVPISAERAPGPAHDPGAPPIVVVGTTQDPATPYPWARALASQLSGGVLLTRQGVDHVALFYSACVRSWDARYLVSLAPPPAATVCPS